MSNWCDNIVTIEFPTPESKANFIAKLEDNSFKQHNTIRKARHIFPLTELGRCVSAETVSPTLPNYDAISHLSGDYFKTRSNEHPAFGLFKPLLNQNPVITEQISATIDRIYADMGAAEHTYDTLSEKKKELVTSAFHQRLNDSHGDDFPTPKIWYDGLITPVSRYPGAVMDFNVFVGFRLTDNLRDGNPFKYQTEEEKMATPYGTIDNQTEYWEEVVINEEPDSAQFKLFTVSTPALPVFRAIFSEFNASGSVVAFNEHIGAAFIERFESGQSILYSEDKFASSEAQSIKAPQYIIDALESC